MDGANLMPQGQGLDSLKPGAAVEGGLYAVHRHYTELRERGSRARAAISRNKPLELEVGYGRQKAIDARQKGSSVSVEFLRRMHWTLRPPRRDLVGIYQLRLRVKRLSRVQRLLSNNHVEGVICVYVSVAKRLPNVDEENFELSGGPS